MSKVVDQRVVEMQFDNKQFERNVSTTMSTLDKLKQKLNFAGASKGLEDINTAAKNSNMSVLGSAVETVRGRFSALEVMGVTALANITNSAVNAGKRIVSALTIDPVKTGFNEYELKMDSVRTIMASTGESVEKVNEYLEELNAYSDQTIYSFSDMTQNIGKFTNAGVKLEDAVLAIKGISNEAAVSGANANEASRAMYNFAQALSAGYVKLIDWKSIELANMATKEFKEQLIETAVATGTLTKASDGMYKTKKGELLNATKNFNDSLKDEWMTTEVLIQTLSRYADKTTEIGAKAFAAAQDVTKLSQMFDVLKETAQSGWARTWEIVFGDIEKAKSIFTPLTNFFSDILEKQSASRNNLLEQIFASPWEQLTAKVTNAGISIDDFNKSVTDTAKEHGISVEELVEEYGSLEKAFRAGKIPGTVLNKVIKKLTGSTEDLANETRESNKYTVQNGDNLTKIAKKYGMTWQELHKLNKEIIDNPNLIYAGQILEVNAAQGEQLEQLSKLTDEQLKSKGYTDEQVKALRELEKAAEKGGTSINELINDITKPSGRELMFESLKNILEAIVKPLGIIKDAWDKTFNASTADILYKIIEKVHEFTESLKMSDDAAENFKKICEGAFAGLQLSFGVIKKSLNTTIKLITNVLGLFGMDLWDLGAIIGDYLVKLRDWLKEHAFVTTALSTVSKAIYEVIVGVRDCVKAFFALKPVKELIDNVKDAIFKFFETTIGGVKDLKLNSFVDKIKDGFANIKKWIESLNDSENLGRDIVLGLINGLKKGIIAVSRATIDLAVNLWKSFCEFFDMHSPSKKMEEAGGNIIEGLLIGIVDGVKTICRAIKDLCVKMVESFEGLDLSKISAVFWAISAFLPQLGIFNIFAALANLVGSMGKSMISSFTKAGENISDGWIWLIDKIKSAISKLIGFLKGINWGAIIATGFGVGMLYTANRMITVFDKLVSPLEALGGMFSAIKSTVKDAGESITKYFNAKKFGVISRAVLDMAIAIGILAASVWVLSKVDSNRLWSAVLAVGALAVIVAGLATLMAFLNKLDKFGGESKSILVIAGSLLILSFAVQKLAEINTDNIPAALKVMAGMIIGISAILIVFGKFSNPATAAYIAKAGIMMVKLSTAMLLMVLVIKLASKLSTGEITKGMGVVTMLGLLFAGLIAVSKLAGQHALKAGLMISMMSSAFLAMLAVIKIASMLDGREVSRGLGVVMLVGLVFAALVAVSHLAGKNAIKAGVMILSMSVALALIVFFMSQLSKLSDENVNRALAAITHIGLIFVAIIAVSKLAGANAAKAGMMLVNMSGALLILTGVMFLLSKFDPKDLKRSLAAVTVLMVLMGGLIAVTKLAADIKKGTLITLVVGIGILALAVAGLSFLNPDKLKNASNALSMVIVAFGLLITATKFAKNTKAMRKSLIQMLGVVAALALIVAALSFVDSKNVVTNVTAVSILLLALGASLVIFSKIGRISTTVSKQIIPMLGVVAGLALIVAGLSFINPGNVLPNVAAVSVLLLTLSGVMAILSFIGPIAAGSVGILALMTVITAGLAAILWGMSALNVENSIQNAVALSTLLLAMSGALILLNFAGPNALAGVGVLALMGLVVAEIAAILGVLAYLDVNPSIESTAAISILLVTMAGVCALMSLIPAAAAISGALGLAAFVGILGAVILAIGALSKIPGFNELLKDGGESLGLIGEALGNFVGGIVKGITTTVASALPEIGTYLSQFMTNVTPFIEGLKNADSSVIAGAGFLAGAIIALSVAELIVGIADLLTFGSGLPGLGTELSNFMSNAEEFIKAASSLDPNMMDGVKMLADTILILTAANVLDGLTSWFTGGSSLASFGEQLPSLGTCLNKFAENLGTFGEEQIVTITCAAAAIKALAEAADTIPNAGGLLAAIVGDNSIAAFGSYLPNLGTHLSQFAKNLGTFGEDQIATIKCASLAIKEMAAAADTLPNEGGWAAAILGDNSIATFGSYLPNLGTHLSQFAKNLGTFNDDQVRTIKCAATAIKEMAIAASDIPNQGGWAAAILGDNSLATFGSYMPKLGTHLSQFAKNLGTFGEDQIATIKCASLAIKEIANVASILPNEGGWAAAILGDNSLATFGNQLPSLGTDLSGFAKNLGTFDASKVETVRQSVNAIRAFATLANSDLKGAKNNMSGFSDKLPGLATDIASFVATMPDTSSTNTSVANLRKIMAVVKEAAAIDATAAVTFTNSLKTLGSNGVDAFVKAFTSEVAKTNVKKATADLAAEAVKGIKSKKEDIKDAADALADSGVSEIKTKSNQDDWKSAGKYLVQGFADGITANTFMAEAKAKAMALAALAKAKAALDINSPSKVFRDEVGRYVPEGFAMGISKFGYMVTDSAVDMANRAVNGVGNAISKISRIVNTDIDSQPTIRPVLDLSEVRTGAGAINDMFGMNPSVGVLANVNSISSMMRQNGQNGNNDDVVYAINKLGRSIAGMPRGNTYQVNGVTYDDGSNITTAIEEIVRQAKIERRR